MEDNHYLKDNAKHDNFDFIEKNSRSTFDLKLVCESFIRSIEDENEIDMLHYLKAYGELIKFFDIFGTLFTFVTKDVYSKIDLLMSYVEDNSTGYGTIHKMIQFEKNQNLLTNQKKPSGSRTLLRLHRALEFISLFLHEVTKLEDNASTVSAARASYQKTLSKYHSWYVRQTVHLATIGLPYRRSLIERVYGGNYPNGGPEIVNKNISYLANITEQVFNATEKLYKEYNILDLP